MIRETEIMMDIVGDSFLFSFSSAPARKSDRWRHNIIDSADCVLVLLHTCDRDPQRVVVSPIFCAAGGGGGVLLVSVAFDDPTVSNYLTVVVSAQSTQQGFLKGRPYNTKGHESLWGDFSNIRPLSTVVSQYKYVRTPNITLVDQSGSGETHRIRLGHFWRHVDVVVY